MGILKQLLFYLPIIGFIVWQIVSLNRDPELRERLWEEYRKYNGI